MDSEDGQEMCESLRKVIERSERRLNKNEKNFDGWEYGRSGRDKVTVETLKKERKEYLKLTKKGIKRIKDELERLQHTAKVYSYKLNT